MSLLNDQVVIITGAAGGIGRAVAALCATHAARLTLVDTGASVDGSSGDPARVDAVAD
jgi:NAD(P)-dependent dehydrogenase (short-subunit alcohol dehydrogenase family)